MIEERQIPNDEIRAKIQVGGAPFFFSKWRQSAKILNLILLCN